MAHCLSVGLVFTVAVATLISEATGSSIGRMMDRQNSEVKTGYQGKNVYPVGVVYTGGGYRPGLSGHYPKSVEDGHLEASTDDPMDSEGDGKISGGVAVDDEVEVFDVPQSNQGGYPGSRRPDGEYPSVYLNGGYPGLYPTLWYLVVYPNAG